MAARDSMLSEHRLGLDSRQDEGRKQMPPRIIARQLSCPSGLLGRLVSFLMNRRNRMMNAFAVRQLEVEPTDRILEIGFGGGVTLRYLIENSGFVTGVDRSRDAVLHAQSRFSREIAAGRAVFHECSAASLPFDEASFDKALTVNTVYFLESLESSFREIHRVLAPGGTLAIGFLPKEWMERMGMPADIFTSRTADEVVSALTHAGFDVVQEKKPCPAPAWLVVVANKRLIPPAEDKATKMPSRRRKQANRLLDEPIRL